MLKKLMFFVTEDWYFWSHRKDLAISLRSYGWEIAVGTRINQYEDQLLTLDLNCYSIPFRRSLSNPLMDCMSSIEMCMKIRRIKPNIVQLIALKPILLSALSVVFNSQVKFIHAFSGMGYLFSSSDKKATILQKPVLLLLRFILTRKCSYVLVQNKSDRALLLAQGWIDPSRIQLIEGSGIDVVKYSPAANPSPPPSGRIRVLLPARLLIDKGVKEFVAAAKMVRRNYPNACFTIAGKLDPENPAGIPESVVNAWVADGDIEWLGHQENMVDLYRSADIVCLPSYREGFPKVLLEAGACRRPIVTTNVPGCADVCIHETTGLLVPPKDAAALAEALMRMIRDANLRDATASALHASVLENYSLDNISQQFDAYYSQLLQI